MDWVGKNPGLRGHPKGGGAIFARAGDTELETTGIDHTKYGLHLYI